MLQRLKGVLWCTQQARGMVLRATRNESETKMKSTYTLTNGKTVTRNSKTTFFTHVVVGYWPHENETRKDTGVFTWNSSFELAEKSVAAFTKRGAYVWIEATDKPQSLAKASAMMGTLIR